MLQASTRPRSVIPVAIAYGINCLAMVALGAYGIVHGLIAVVILPTAGLIGILGIVMLLRGNRFGTVCTAATSGFLGASFSLFLRSRYCPAAFVIPVTLVCVICIGTFIFTLLPATRAYACRRYSAPPFSAGVAAVLFAGFIFCLLTLAGGIKEHMTAFVVAGIVDACILACAMAGLGVFFINRRGWGLSIVRINFIIWLCDSITNLFARPHSTGMFMGIVMFLFGIGCVTWTTLPSTRSYVGRLPSVQD